MAKKLIKLRKYPDAGTDLRKIVTEDARSVTKIRVLFSKARVTYS
jgi:hypothetical protein